MGGTNLLDGPPIKAVIGYEILKRLVTVIDYAGHRITFMNPAGFQPSAQAQAVKFKFNEHIPTIQAAIDGIVGDFEIDTGAWSSLILMGPFSAAHRLAEKYQATRRVIAGDGVGGQSRALLLRPETLQIGTFEIRQPVGEMLLDKQGVAADPRLAGNIGGGILHRFTLTFDYPHQLLYLEPNADFAEADVYDRSGLWLTRDGADAFSVKDVVADSPAARAGLTVGDRIIAIDGIKASGLGMTALRQRLRGVPGTPVRLTVRGLIGSHEVAITLADLI
jgi:hypothetical protein